MLDLPSCSKDLLSACITTLTRRACAGKAQMLSMHRVLSVALLMPRNPTQCWAQ